MRHVFFSILCFLGLTTAGLSNESPRLPSSQNRGDAPEVIYHPNCNVFIDSSFDTSLFLNIRNKKLLQNYLTAKGYRVIDSAGRYSEDIRRDQYWLDLRVSEYSLGIVSMVASHYSDLLALHNFSRALGSEVPYPEGGYQYQIGVGNQGIPSSESEAVRDGFVTYSFSYEEANISKGRGLIRRLRNQRHFRKVISAMENGEVSFPSCQFRNLPLEFQREN